MNNMVQELNKIESLKIESEKELEKVKGESQYALSQANREVEKVKAELDKVKLNSQYALSQANRELSQTNHELEKVKADSQYALERERKNIAEVQKRSDYYYQLAADRYDEVRELRKLTNEVESLKSQLVEAKSSENYYYYYQKYIDAENEIEKLKKLNLGWDKKYSRLNSQFSDYQNKAEKNGQQWKEHSDRLEAQNAQLTKKLAEENSFTKSYTLWGTRR